MAVIIFLYGFAFTFGKGRINIDGLNYVVFGLMILFLIANILLKRFIYEITLNSGTSEIIFKLYRKQEILRVKPVDVKFSRRLGYLIFSVKNRKMVYNGEIRDDLISSLSKIIDAASPNL